MFHTTGRLTITGLCALGLILAVLLAACGSESPPASTPTTAAGSTSADATGSATAAATVRPTATSPSLSTIPCPGPERDRAALVALYNATDGESWDDNYEWLSDAPLHEWRGVSTDYNGCVTGLSLSPNRLSGEIPAELGNLANLEWLYLSGNQLSGEIPAELGNLANLESLNLSGNQLSGEIPAELGNLANLEFLYLHENQLSGCLPAGLQGVQGPFLSDLSYCPQ